MFEGKEVVFHDDGFCFQRLRPDNKKPLQNLTRREGKEKRLIDYFHVFEFSSLLSSPAFYGGTSNIGT